MRSLGRPAAWRVVFVWAVLATGLPSGAEEAALARQAGDATVLGERVRVASRSALLTGTAVGLDGDALTVALDDGGEAVRLALAEVQRLEVSGGRPNRVARAGYGAAIGLLAATLIAAAVFDEREYDSGYGVDLLAGALFGLPIGAAVGLASTPRERWHEVDWHSARAPSGESAALAFQIRLRF